MDELRNKLRPLSIQFVDQLFIDPATLDSTSAQGEAEFWLAFLICEPIIGRFFGGDFLFSF